MLDSVISELNKILKEQGISEYEIYCLSSSNTSVETLDGEVSSFSSGNRGGMCLRVVIDGRMGYASTELLRPEEMTYLATAAIENAIATEKQDTVGIYSGGDGYEQARARAVFAIDSSELRRLALDIAKETYAASDKVTKGTSTAAESFAFNIRIVNSHGLDLSASCGNAALLSAAVIKDGTESQSAYSIKEYDPSREQETVREISKRAVREAEEKVGASLVESGKYNVIIEGKQMRSILSVFATAFSGKTAIDGMSRLKDKVGEKIASGLVNITDDPQRDGSPIGVPFDAEGVPTHRKDVVKNGVLTTLLHNRETALQMGVKTTANASKAGYSAPIGVRPYSFAIEPSDTPLDEMLCLAKNGIYITDVKGIHAGANPVTGDFSLECAGFMIEEGRIGCAVKSFTIAGNFFDLLLEIEAVGDTLECGVPSGLTNYCSPAVLVKNISVAGK